MKKLRAWTSSAEDWVNPVAIKEFRQAVQSRWVIAVLMLFLLINVIIVGGFLATSPDAAVSAGHGRDMFSGLLVLLLLTCMGFVPLYAGLRLSLERNDANIDLLFITTIRPAGIVRGKYFSALSLTLLIFSVCMPFMVVTYLLGGIDLPTIFLLLAIGYAVCAVANALGICAGAVSGSWLLRGLAAGGVVICLCYSGAGAISILMGMLMRERWLGIVGASEFWGVLLTMAFLAVLAIGLLYVLAVALLSPKLSNRMLAPRLYLVSTWLVTGCLACVWSWINSAIEPIETWMICSGIAWMVTAVAAMSEREAWTTRVRRTIPRNPLLRTGAFLLYTGSAGGLIWSTLMFVATIVAANGIRGWFGLGSVASGRYSASYSYSADPFLEATVNLSLVFGYVLCYCLTTAFLRMNVLRRLPTEPLSLLTVVIGLLFWFVPYLFTFMLVTNWWQEPPWYLLGSPLVLAMSHASVTDMVGPVVVGWLVLGIVGAFPWAYRQRRNFMPLEEK